MELTEVVSSNIKGIGYEDNKLIVEYLGGSKYEYKDVPKDLYESLLETHKKGESVGSFINKKVKGTFEYSKLN